MFSFSHKQLLTIHTALMDSVRNRLQQALVRAGSKTHDVQLDALHWIIALEVPAETPDLRSPLFDDNLRESILLLAEVRRMLDCTGREQASHEP